VSGEGKILKRIPAPSIGLGLDLCGENFPTPPVMPSVQCGRGHI